MATPASTSARRKQLTDQLEACFQEIQQLSLQFRDGIERLESATLSNLMVESAAEWFRMYLRLVDLGVEIRRGEQRHRSSRAIVFPCQHTTGTKGARHTGLSIDDANALYQLLEDTRGVRDSQLEVYFMRMDALDRDGVGLLDEKLSACLSAFLRLPSVWYTRVETTGSDPHQELLLYTSRSSVTKITRVCFSASACLCLPDAQPWTQFQVFAAGDATVEGRGGEGEGGGGATLASTHNASSAGGMADDVDVLASRALDGEEIGLAELKRQYGFDPSLSTQDDDDDDDSSSSHDATHTLAHKRRRLSATTTTTATSTMALGRAPQPPREIYRRKCQERGLARKRKIEELLVVNNQGLLELNLSHFGFHAPQDLQDLLDVVVETQVPIALVDVTNNFFDARSFELFAELLKLPLVRQHVRALSLRCMALPQRSDFAVLLRILTDTDAGAFEQLTSLDLSYNTFFEDAVLSLNDLLNGLQSLQRLSLESCFPKAPDPAVVEVAVVKDLVRTALVACCDRLQSLNFGSNWMSFPLLNSLLGPESALEELHLAQMTFFYFDSSRGNDEAAAAMAAAPTIGAAASTRSDVDAMSWQFSFQRQRSLTLSETRQSRSEYLPFCLDALTYCLKMRLATLQRLDLHVLAPVQRKTSDILGGWGTSASATATMVAPLEMHLDERMTDLLLAIAAYGALRSLRLKFDPEPPSGTSTSTNPSTASTLHAISSLFQNGLQHCESLELALNVPMSLLDLKELLAQLRAPCLTSLKLSVALLPLANGGGEELRRVEFRRVFRSAVASLHELTLDFRVPLSQSKTLLPDALVQEMENVWRSIGLPPDATTTTTTTTNGDDDDDDGESAAAKKKNKKRSSSNAKSSFNPRTVSLVKRKPKKDGAGSATAGDAVVPRDLMTFAFLFTDGKRSSPRRS